MSLLQLMEDIGNGEYQTEYDGRMEMACTNCSGAEEHGFFKHTTDCAFVQIQRTLGSISDKTHVIVPREPTEEMVDAPRQIILYSETVGRSLEGLRNHLEQAGVDYSHFPEWAKKDKGHLTKAAIAILVYVTMIEGAQR